MLYYVVCSYVAECLLLCILYSVFSRKIGIRAINYYSLFRECMVGKLEPIK